MTAPTFRGGQQLEDASLTLVETFDDVLDLSAWLGERRDWLAVDTETTGLNVGQDRVRTVQFGDEHRAFVVPFDGWRELCRLLLGTYDGRVTFWNALFDTKFLAATGTTIPQQNVHDSMIMGHLVDPVRSNRLKDVASRMLGASAREGQDVLRTAFKTGGWDFSTIPIDHPAYWQYSAMDTILLARVTPRLWEESAPYRNIYETELAFINLLRGSEITGMLVDPRYCEHAAEHYEARLAELGVAIPCDPLSPTQVIRALQEAGAVLTHRTERGQLSTDDTVLRPLSETIPFAGHIIEYRTAHNIAHNYLRKMLHLRDSGDRVHASTKPVEARTGRASVTDPPLQTVPRGRSVRDAFIAEEGHVLVLADYGGMELRAMAADANEQTMIAAFERGDDVHTWTAAQIYGVPMETITRKQRELAKNSGFAKIYGAGIEKFAATAGVTIEEATTFLGRYDQLFPAVAQWQGRTIATATSRRQGRSWGYIETPAGRRLPIEPRKEYKACNYRIQGGCAEISKEAAVRLDSAGLGQYFRLFVHDEFILEVPEDFAEEAQRIVVDVMRDGETFGPSPVLTAESEAVARWGAKYHGERNELLEEVMASAS